MELGIDSIKIINHPANARQLYLTLIKTASTEILLIFPTINAIRREEKIGVIDELIKAANRNVKIRMLSPEDDFVKEHLDLLKSNRVSVKRIEIPSEAKFKLLIVDSKIVLIVETKDDSKSEFTEAIGLTTISNSDASVQPYVGIFESFWRETELYEKARDAERIKDEFINIAAHELRNPLMPIIASTENLKDDIDVLITPVSHKTAGIRESLYSSLNIILRNSARLLQLSEDILQVSKIESGTFKLNLESVKFNSLINQVISDVKKKYLGTKPDVRYVFESRQGKRNDEIFILFCDRSKITQAIVNLLDNASKFTSKGEIEISSSRHNNEIILNIKDSGIGIDPIIKGRLFEKFASKSEKGVGLGLYITRKIIEAHGGRIWASNNANGRGAIFSFALPTDLQQKEKESRRMQEYAPNKAKSLTVM